MKKLEELLNLPESKTIIEKERKKAEPTPIRSEEFFRNVAEIDKISAGLPLVSGLGDLADNELDALSQRATDAYDDLMDLGMNVEARFSGRIFEVASSMLKNAIDAKTAKIDKKLKMLDLQLKKARLDKSNADSGNESISLNGEGYIVTDRNSLLEKLKNIKEE